MMKRRPHWDDDLLAAVLRYLHDPAPLTDDDRAWNIVEAVEDWQDRTQQARAMSMTDNEAAIARVRELHRPCSDPHLHDGSRCCLECSDYGRQGVVRMYPCDTIRALDGTP